MKLSKPSKAQAVLLPAFGVSCKTENRNRKTGISDGLSQQSDLHRELSRIKLCVQGSWLCSLLLGITPLDFDSVACTTELEIRFCPEILLQRTRRDRSPQSFAETATVLVLAHLAFELLYGG